MDELHRRLARRVREIANERALPLTHVADRAAVSRSHFFSVLGGEKSPTLKWIGQVATALEVDAADLLTRQRGSSKAG